MDRKRIMSKINSFLLAIIALSEKDGQTENGESIKTLAIDVSNMLSEFEKDGGS